MEQGIEHSVGPVELAVRHLADPLEQRVPVALTLGEDRQHERCGGSGHQVLVDAHAVSLASQAGMSAGRHVWNWHA